MTEQKEEMTVFTLMHGKEALQLEGIFKKEGKAVEEAKKLMEKITKKMGFVFKQPDPKRTVWMGYNNATVFPYRVAVTSQKVVE